MSLYPFAKFQLVSSLFMETQAGATPPVGWAFPDGANALLTNGIDSNNNAVGSFVAELDLGLGRTSWVALAGTTTGGTRNRFELSAFTATVGGVTAPFAIRQLATQPNDGEQEFVMPRMDTLADGTPLHQFQTDNGGGVLTLTASFGAARLDNTDPNTSPTALTFRYLRAFYGRYADPQATVVMSDTTTKPRLTVTDTTPTARGVLVSIARDGEPPYETEMVTPKNGVLEWVSKVTPLPGQAHTVSYRVMYDADANKEIVLDGTEAFNNTPGAAVSLGVIPSGFDNALLLNHAHGEVERSVGSSGVWEKIGWSGPAMTDYPPLNTAISYRGWGGASTPDVQAASALLADGWVLTDCVGRRHMLLRARPSSKADTSTSEVRRSRNASQVAVGFIDEGGYRKFAVTVLSVDERLELLDILRQDRVMLRGPHGERSYVIAAGTITTTALDATATGQLQSELGGEAEVDYASVITLSLENDNRWDS